MGVREQLELISEALEESRTEMQRGLETISEFIHTNENGKIWRIRAQWYNGFEMREEELFVEIYGLQTPRWRPKVGGGMPYGYGDAYSIVSWTTEWHPAAKTAADRYSSKQPFLSQLMDGESRDVRELIRLPEEVGKFVDSWQDAANALTPLPAAMDGVLLVDTRVNWSGPGYRAYQDVVKKTNETAKAAKSAIDKLKDHSLDYVEQGLALCQTLRDVARAQADNAVNTVQSLSDKLDPKKWLSIVNVLIDSVQETNKMHRQVYDAGIKQLSNVATILNDIENTFSALAMATGSPVDGIEWPKPHSQVDERWDGSPA